MTIHQEAHRNPIHHLFNWYNSIHSIISIMSSSITLEALKISSSCTSSFSFALNFVVVAAWLSFFFLIWLTLLLVARLILLSTRILGCSMARSRVMLSFGLFFHQNSLVQHLLYIMLHLHIVLYVTVESSKKQWHSSFSILRYTSPQHLLIIFFHCPWSLSKSSYPLMQLSMIVLWNKSFAHKRLHLSPCFNRELLIVPPVGNQLIPSNQGVVIEFFSSNFDLLSFCVLLVVEHKLNLFSNSK